MNVTPLRVGNEEFLVSSLIERCPKSMMLRELVKNGLESAARATEGDRRVEIGFLRLDGARKLTIWNTGPGMDADELYRMCDLASSIGKQQSLAENFGMGAKVASLPSNQHGIRYRSCKAGRVQQVIMGKREGVYGRVKQDEPDGTSIDVREATSEAQAEGRSLEGEWTEVVLLGNHPDQETLIDPYDGDPAVPPGWIAHELITRFYRIPKGIDVILMPGTHPVRGAMPFVGIGDRTEAYAQYEAVPTENGVVVHYLYDAANPKDPQRMMASVGALEPTRSYAAIIFRDEIYDNRMPHWLREAPMFGITFGIRNLSVHIELPDDYPLVPDAYRQFLRRAGNLQAQVATVDFASMALNHRPQWVLDLMKTFAPDSKHIQGIRDEAYELFKSLRVRRRWWPKIGPGEKARPAQSAKEPAETDEQGEPVFYEAAPEIIAISDPGDVAQRGLKDSAARFYPESHQIFVNVNYSAFMVLRESLEREFSTAEDQEAVRGAVQVAVEQSVIRQICRKIVFGLAKRDLWQAWQVDAALNSFSLTLTADDQVGTAGRLRTMVANELKAPAKS